MPDGPYRILVTGSRTWDDSDRLVHALCAAAETPLLLGRPVIVVHGACPTGADDIASRVVRSSTGRGWDEEAHPADWAKGRSAGYVRNARMVGAGADVCLAFIRGASKGASHTADLAEKAGIETRRYLA